MGTSFSRSDRRSLPLVSGLASVFLANPCPLCDRSCREPLCANCQRQLQRCQLVSSNLPQSTSLPIFSWGAYGGTLKQAIAALKYDGHPELAQPLGLHMGQAWLRHQRQQRSAPGTVVVPIPLHTDKQRQRGFNQADLLARWFSRVTRLPVRSQGLQRLRATTAQHSLGGRERQRNLAGAFALGPDFQRQRPANVLLLDDIYTTGATAKAAATVLTQQGISVIGICTLARAIADT